jgi:CheY-like chemotaxis protein
VIENSILIVDDHPASRMYLANFLKVKEFKVLEEPTGQEGLIAAWRDAPDLVLFDPALTDISDRGFIHKLRNDPRTNRTPLVALSSDPAPSRKQIWLNAGGEKGSSLIVFLSAKGGTGTSSLCANFAMNIQRDRRIRMLSLLIGCTAYERNKTLKESAR